MYTTEHGLIRHQSTYLRKWGFTPFEHYVIKRRNSIADYVATRPIYNLCVDGRREHGTSHHHEGWWQQPMTLDGEDTDEV